MNRIKYNVAPLVEVIIQLRFPTILALNTQDPYEFQNRIRDSYPFYNCTTQEVKENQPNGSSRVISQTRNHAFISKDKKKKINIESTFIAISTHSYTVWEDFKKDVDDVLKIFIDIYHPAFYTRIGLRYIDVIERSKWGLQDSKWQELITPSVLGFVGEDTKTYRMDSETFNASDETSARYHFELAKSVNTQEDVFIIDCDYFAKLNIELSELNSITENLHKHSSNFIRKAITDKLHNAMQPIEI